MKHPYKYLQIKIIFIAFALLGSSMLYAQPGQQRGRRAFEQIEAEKTAFFTRYMELTSREAKLFWPLYEDFQSRRNALIQERHQISARFRNQEGLEDSEVRNMSSRYVDLQVREAALVREFHEEFNSVLPPEKVMRLYLAENEFRMQLLRRVRGGRGWENGRPGRN